MTRVLLIDNRDSFTFNLFEACRASGAEVEVMRNSVSGAAALERALGAGALLMLSPGPGVPAAAGCCLDLIRLARGRLPLIGICLGHQAIVEARGGTVERAAQPCHGKVSLLDHDSTGPFAGLPSPLRVGRYHSLCTPVARLPAGLHVHAALDGMAMAIADRAAGQFGLQFHPESILTPMGGKLIKALLVEAEGLRANLAALTSPARAGKVAA